MKSNLCSCIYCREVKTSKGIHVHVDRTHLGSKKYSSGNNGRYEEISKKAEVARLVEISKYQKKPNRCTECQSVLDYDKRDAKFCSNSCSGSYNNRNRIRSEESKNKTRDSIRKYNESHGKQCKPKIPFIQICLSCGNPYNTFRKTQQFCSTSCAMIHRNKSKRAERSDFANYGADCRFNFNLKDFPNKFDFSLIEQFGWYKAKNRGDNLQGVSRDHMVSVRYGFENGIDPKIIAHPANCKLMRHGENSSKHSKCSITLEELKQRIVEWDN